MLFYREILNLNASILHLIKILHAKQQIRMIREISPKIDSNENELKVNPVAKFKCFGHIHALIIVQCHSVRNYLAAQ